MDHHFDSKIVLSEDSKYKNLYKWSLSEVGENLPRYQQDQIPWTWPQYFQLIDAHLVNSFGLREKYVRDNPEFPVVTEKEHIHAKLFAGVPGQQSLTRNTSYSMLGTNRKITNINLVIYPALETESEKCAAAGFVSFTSDLDSPAEKIPDTLCFYLHLRPKIFARVAQYISDQVFEIGTLRVGGVDGFYSNWTLDGFTSHIKVLTSHKEHAVEIPEGCSIVPPRLGKILEMELGFLGKKVFAVPLTADPQDGLSSADADYAPASHNPFAQQERPDPPPMLNPKLLPLLNSIRAAAWIIAGVLLLILFKHA